jgi:L-amino acid N-acyltransferase YncA
VTMLVRLATLEDANQIREVYAPYCDTPISFEASPPTADEMRRRITKVLAGHPWLVCEEDGQVLGYAYAGPHGERAAYRWSVDVTVYVGLNRHRQGLGRALYTSLFELLHLQGFVSAYAGVTIPNPASVGLHQAMGFVPVGVYRPVGFKDGAWRDVAWLQRTPQPAPVDPAEPTRLPEIVGTAGWAAALQSGLRFLRRGLPN